MLPESLKEQPFPLLDSLAMLETEARCRLSMFPDNGLQTTMLIRIFGDKCFDDESRKGNSEKGISFQEEIYSIFNFFLDNDCVSTVLRQIVFGRKS